ncbi:DUF72 domain-containing protein [Niabella ginsengisoli]|uniref:DUF72 domain-containing protein n=1 Tax=Niabella ginsengisoli TaxID=522298 RepID=A0ABS9SNX9_9BACT|nr:DUF72 domain-containing protein [Niabella ginsengisoli]MCH5600089.1 DUF72 domain-containing protein [Niabella ginsengisoli]
MKFGQVSDPSGIDFKLPKDAAATTEILGKSKVKHFEAYVGCAKWNKTDLKGFYPKGIKDELAYYSGQFNSIELNATFYGMPTADQVVKWTEKTPKEFKFFPKLTNSISHFKRLTPDSLPLAETFCNAISNFEKKLGMAFLQLHDKFSPKEFDKLQNFINNFPKGIPLAVEVRNEAWFSDPLQWGSFCNLLEKKKMSNIIVDTAGRRDMVHMRLTTPEAFIRFVGCNDDKIDKKRLDDWLKRIEKWHQEGLKKLYFFVHQNVELSSPLLSAYFIEKLNKNLNLDLKIPEKPVDKKDNGQKKLF